MPGWGFWEWLAYICIFVAALMLAADTGMKSSDRFTAISTALRSSAWWNMAPLLMLCISAAVVLAYQVGVIAPLPSPAPIVSSSPASSSDASGIRTLHPDQKERMRPLLGLAASEHYSLQINSNPNCDECEQFAEDIRDFINTVPGWTAGGGPLNLFGSKYRYGVWIVSRPDEKDSAPVQKIDKAFRDAGIPLEPDTEDFPKGTFVIVIARQRKS
jgi:hypothetical protein